MGKGGSNKSDGLFHVKRKADANRAKTANVTLIGKMPRKSKVDDAGNALWKDWVRKELESTQEVLIESVTGEIYRYIIGGPQPKIRTADAHTILSELVFYRSFRDIQGPANPEHIVDKEKWHAAFRENIEGFMRVMFSTIMLAENDLSDMNYGLEVTSAKGVSETYGEFIKIDHGQSLNEMRIADLKDRSSFFSKKRFAKKAEIKYYDPLDSQALGAADTRGKSDRSSRFTMWQSRRYALGPHTIDRLAHDFVLGRVNKAYIDGLDFQPSALPFFDGRLLSVLHGDKDRSVSETASRVEVAKYMAIATMVFTDDRVYREIGKRAAHNDEPATVKLITDSIVAKKRALLEAVSCDPDFSAWLASEGVAIWVGEVIAANLKRMKHKVDGVTASERYGDMDLGSGVDEGALEDLVAVGRVLGDETLTRAVRDALLSVAAVLAEEWGDGKRVDVTSLRAFAGIPLEGAATARLPHSAEVMAAHLQDYLHNESRLLRTYLCLCFESVLSSKKAAGFFSGRSSATVSKYDAIEKILTDAAVAAPALTQLRASTQGRKNEKDVNFYESLLGAAPNLRAASKMVVPEGWDLAPRGR